MSPRLEQDFWFSDQALEDATTRAARPAPRDWMTAEALGGTETDLRDLCALGFLETIEDQGVRKYRKTRRK